MLIRTYVQQIDLGNSDSPFIVQNAASYSDRLDADIVTPTEQELAAPGLIIQPLTDSESEIEKFWSGLSSAYIDEELPESVVDALKGKESPWKIVRCIPKILGEDEEVKTFFMLVNPTTIKHRGTTERTIEERGQGVEQDVENGIIEAYLSAVSVRTNKFNIIVKHHNGPDDYYTMWMRTSGEFRFTEYYPDGRIKRHSEVYAPDQNEQYGTIYVTEYV